jgi:hypothetical protein
MAEDQQRTKYVDERNAMHREDELTLLSLNYFNIYVFPFVD